MYGGLFAVSMLVALVAREAPFMQCPKLTDDTSRPAGEMVERGRLHKLACRDGEPEASR